MSFYNINQDGTGFEKAGPFQKTLHLWLIDNVGQYWDSGSALIIWSAYVRFREHKNSAWGRVLKFKRQDGFIPLEIMDWYSQRIKTCLNQFCTFTRLNSSVFNEDERKIVENWLKEEEPERSVGLCVWED